MLEFAVGGLAGKEIAARCGIKHQTVRNHLLSIRRALGASNTSHAVRLAIERKLIEVSAESGSGRRDGRVVLVWSILQISEH